MNLVHGIRLVAPIVLVLTVSLMGCSDSGSTTVVEYLPSLSPSGGITTQAVTDAGDTAANVRYYAAAPLLSSFAENSLGVAVGDTFVSTNDVFGAVTFTISESSGVVTYEGRNADDSIRVTATYDAAERTIGYEQILYINDEADVLQGEGGILKMVVYTRFADIPLEEDGSFIGPAEIVVLFAQGPNIGFQATAGENGEVFHGIIDGTNTGTGYAIGRGADSIESGTAFPDGTDKPASAEAFADLDKMYRYITGVTPDGFVSAVGGASPSGTILYRIGDAEAVQYESLDISENPVYPPDFTGAGLTGWAEKTSLK